MRILMVCLGNICRSPLAQGILEDICTRNGLDWYIDSAGTGAYHVGEAPDPRSINEASKHHIDITDQRARKFIAEDFDRFDLILAMDASNYQHIMALGRSDLDRSKVKMILNYTSPGQNRSVPDPYYNNGFSQVYDMIRCACDKLIEGVYVIK